MKRRLIISLLLAAIMLLVPASAVFAGTTAQITITATPGRVSIAISPSSWTIGVIDEGTTQYSNNATPTWPLVDGDALFTVTNDGTGAVNVTVTGAAFTGGVGWTLTSGAPGENTVRVKAYKEGDNEAAGIILTTSAQAFLSALTTNVDMELRIETGTYTDIVAKTGSVTLTAAR